jgi:hypothetical protein
VHRDDSFRTSLVIVCQQGRTVLRASLEILRVEGRTILRVSLEFLLPEVTPFSGKPENYVWKTTQHFGCVPGNSAA